MRALRTSVFAAGWGRKNGWCASGAQFLSHLRRRKAGLSAALQCIVACSTVHSTSQTVDYTGSSFQADHFLTDPPVFYAPNVLRHGGLWSSDAETGNQWRLSLLPCHLRGGAGGGARTRIEGATRKGFLLGLKRGDNGNIIQEDNVEKLRPRTEEELRALKEEEEREIREATANHATAGAVAGQALELLLQRCRPGASVARLCELGDALVAAELKKAFPAKAWMLDRKLNASEFSTKERGGERKRISAHQLGAMEGEVGVGFPTTVAPNHVCGRFAPVRGEHDVRLQLGDVVKVDVSCHVDGYISTAAQTILVDALNQANLQPQQRNVLMAAQAGARALLRQLRPGVLSYHVTDHVEKELIKLGCRAVDGSLSRRVTRDLPDGAMEKLIAHRRGQVVNDDRMEPPECEVERGEIWYIDVVVSTGDGKARMKSSRQTTVFRRLWQNKWIHLLKLRYARDLLNKVLSWKPRSPFHLRYFPLPEDFAGINECIKRQLVIPYPVLYERRGEFVAQCKLTVVVEEKGVRILSGPVRPACTGLEGDGLDELWRWREDGKVVHSDDESLSEEEGGRGRRVGESGAGKRDREEDEEEKTGGETEGFEAGGVEGVGRHAHDWVANKVRKMVVQETAAEAKGKEDWTAKWRGPGSELPAVDGYIGDGNESAGVDKWVNWRGGGQFTQLLEALTKGESVMNQILMRTRAMRGRLTREGRDANGEPETRQYSTYVVAMCQRFLSPDVVGFRFLDGDSSNRNGKNLRFVTALDAFEAAMEEGQAWRTDFVLPLTTAFTEESGGEGGKPQEDELQSS